MKTPALIYFAFFVNLALEKTNSIIFTAEMGEIPAEDQMLQFILTKHTPTWMRTHTVGAGLHGELQEHGQSTRDGGAEEQNLSSLQGMPLASALLHSLF